MVVWEGKDLLHGVDCPAEEDLFCAPGGVAFAELFLREMGSSRAMSSLLFGWKSSSMARKRCRVICRLSVAPPLGYTDEIIEVYFDMG